MTHDWLPGVRADDLRADDRILMFGHVIRIVASRPLEELPGVQAVTFRTNRSDRDIETTLPTDWRMLALDAPRTELLPCLLCGKTSPAPVNLAQPATSFTVCASCGGHQ